MTSATVATVGVGLTIPLALLSDIFVMDRYDVTNTESIIGALFVMIGFVFVNVPHGKTGQEKENINISNSGFTHSIKYP